MKRLICALAILFGGTANAGVLSDFTGYYDVTNWSTSIDGDGLVFTGLAPEIVVEIGSNDGIGSGFTNFTIAAGWEGQVSFDWVYQTNDAAFYDPFGYLINDVFTELTSGSFLSQNESGTASFYVKSGDVFGFSQQSTDSCCGAGVTAISEFQVVSAPATLALVCLGLGLLGMTRRKSS